MVGMTRAFLADPHHVRKLAEGREAEIRPCVGAGYCVDRVLMGKDALCLHNVATGRELSPSACGGAKRGRRGNASSWWAAGRPASRRRGSRLSAAIASRCSRRPANSADRSCWRRRRPGGAIFPASCAGSRARWIGLASRCHLNRYAEAGDVRDEKRRMSSSSRPAGFPRSAISPARNSRRRSGTCSRVRSRRPARARPRRIGRPCAALLRPVSRRARLQGRDRDARQGTGPRNVRHQLRRAHDRALQGGRHDNARYAAPARDAARQPPACRA